MIEKLHSSAKFYEKTLAKNSFTSLDISICPSIDIIYDPSNVVSAAIENTCYVIVVQ